MAKETKSVDALDALLGADLKIEKDVFIKRLNAHFTIKALDGNTINRITEQCTQHVGKGRNRKKELDEQKFGALVILKACVAPNFGDKRLLEKYGATLPEEVVTKALLAGEIARLAGEIMELSGFDDDEDGIEEVKN